MEEVNKKTGTTILGMVCKDGVIIATERRATMGTLIAHKATKKLYKIDEHMALATAGLVGDLHDCRSPRGGLPRAQVRRSLHRVQAIGATLDLAVEQS